FDQFRCADEFGFDWVTVAEHHYSGFSLTPNPMVMAGARCPPFRPAKDLRFGAAPPPPNPPPGAGQAALLHRRARRRGGRGLAAARMGGTPKKYVTYTITRGKARGRFAGARQ